MKKILLPTDFSDNSWNAIKYALELFKDEECQFHLLNTYTPLIFQLEYTTAGGVNYELVDTMKNSSEKGLKKLMSKIKKKFNNPNHIFSRISSFNTLLLEIDELLKGNVIDYIIMGTKGATGAKEILFGTNTVHVIKNAKCPVLAIPSEFVFEKPYEILFPSDYELNFQDNHLEPIKNIASLYNSRINILNVSYGYDLTEKQEQNKLKLERYFKKMAYLFHSYSNQEVPEAIASFQLKTRVNLLVMINNKHSFFKNLFFKSTINQIGFHLNIPLLVIPSIK
jgi:nucleotide-binding universal stress UspA family protein